MDAIDWMLRLRGLPNAGVRETDNGQGRADEFRVDHQVVSGWQ